MPNAGPSVSSILDSLSPDLLCRLFDKATRRGLRTDEPLFRKGDTGDGCYRLESGLLKVLVESPEGDELIIAFLCPGAMVGELSVIDGLPRSATAVAVKDCELSFITRHAFDACIRAHPEIFQSVSQSLAARLRYADDCLAAASFLDSNARVARALLELAALVGQDVGNGDILIDQQVRQRDIAAMAGIARENVSRILGVWKHRKLVRQGGQHRYIINPAGLEQEVKGQGSTTFPSRVPRSL
jgi:CRP/FNR family transcriptional regulator